MTALVSSFDRYGPALAASPVVLSVPHAGRNYPEAMRATARLPAEALMALEDRHVDALALAAHRSETLFVQRCARAWIDLNRAEDERDPKLDEGADHAMSAISSPKLRSGLGLVPRRIASHGEIWRGKLSAAEVQARIIADHRPYHAALAEALASARARFGVAVLIDIHSMPPLGAPGTAARIILGDRFGKSAGARFVARIEAEAERSGLASALNAPYSGGHILDRHAAPGAGIHAIQIEFDRALYLDPGLSSISPQLPALALVLRRMIDAVCDEALAGAPAIAAE